MHSDRAKKISPGPMGNELNTLRAIMPDFAKRLYRRGRRYVRYAHRLFRGVMDCKVREVRIKVGVSSETEQWRAETYANKEPETLDWLDEHLRAGDVFYDVGANVGLYSLYAAKIRPSCTVYAFEPGAANYSRLCNNLVLNDFDNVIPCNFAISDEEIFDLFCVVDPEAGASLHSLGGRSPFFDESTRVVLRQGVLTTTLDALVQKSDIPHPSLLKIDVDGTEEEIISGAEDVLSSGRVRSVLIELNWRKELDVDVVTRRIVRCGYRLGWVRDWIFERNGVRGRTYIFERM